RGGCRSITRCSGDWRRRSSGGSTPSSRFESIHDFNAKFEPQWIRRSIYFEAATSLPRVALAYLEAEALVRLPLSGPGAACSDADSLRLSRNGPVSPSHEPSYAPLRMPVRMPRLRGSSRQSTKELSDDSRPARRPDRPRRDVPLRPGSPRHGRGERRGDGVHHHHQLPPHDDVDL